VAVVRYGPVYHGPTHLPFHDDFSRFGLWHISIFGPTEAVVAGDYANPVPFFIPAELDETRLRDVELYVVVVSASGDPTVQIHNVTGSVDMLTTAVSCDAGEKTSLTATTPVVIDATNSQVAAGDEVRFDVDDAGSGTLGMLVKVGFW